MSSRRISLKKKEEDSKGVTTPSDSKGATTQPTNYLQAVSIPKTSIDLVSQNRFTVLGNLSPAGMSKPNSSTPILKPAIFSPLPKLLPKQSYHIKLGSYENLFYPEKDFLDVQNKSKASYDSIISKLFYPGFNFHPDQYGHTREFYEYILIDSKSAIIEHSSNKGSNTIDFSKLRIEKIMTPYQWGLPLWRPRTFNNVTPEFHQYNYYDYAKAWLNVFYLRSFNHSWFIYFHKDLINYPFPAWFINDCWFYWGMEKELLPPSCQEGFEMFQKFHRQSDALSSIKDSLAKDSLSLIRFCIKFSIPWIMAWQFILLDEEGSECFAREFRVKMWEKFNPTKCSKEEVQNIYSPKLKINKQDPIQDQASFLTAKSKMQAELAACTDPEEWAKLCNRFAEASTSSQNSPKAMSIDGSNSGLMAIQFAQDPFEDFNTDM